MTSFINKIIYRRFEPPYEHKASDFKLLLFIFLNFMLYKLISFKIFRWKCKYKQ